MTDKLRFCRDGRIMLGDEKFGFIGGVSNRLTGKTYVLWMGGNRTEYSKFAEAKAAARESLNAKQ